MDSIEEKRVYGDRDGALDAYVSSSIGVVRVRVADDTVGEFGLCDRCTARDVATIDGAVAIATDEDVRMLTAGEQPGEATTFEPTGFGPAVAVGADDGGFLAAGPNGDVGRLDVSDAADARTSEGDRTDADEGTEEDEWESLESDGVAAVRAIDGDLVGTESGVYRVHEGHLDHAGLSNVRDVSAAGVPLAATADGLYKLGNGWMEALEGSFDTVAADRRAERGRLARAHAVADDAIYAYDPETERWNEYDRSSERIAGIDYGETAYAVTEGGSFLAATPDDGASRWRSQTIGIRDVTGMVVASGT